MIRLIKSKKTASFLGGVEIVVEKRAAKQIGKNRRGRKIVVPRNGTLRPRLAHSHARHQPQKAAKPDEQDLPAH